MSSPSTVHPHAHLLAQLVAELRAQQALDLTTISDPREVFTDDALDRIASAASCDSAETFADIRAVGIAPPVDVLPEGLSGVEGFACHARRLEMLDPAEGDPVEVPQVLLILDGVPAVKTLTGQKTYLTSLGGDDAVALGEGLVEFGRDTQQAERALRARLDGDPARPDTGAGPAPPARRSGLIIATTADLRHVGPGVALNG